MKIPVSRSSLKFLVLSDAANALECGLNVVRPFLRTNLTKDELKQIMNALRNLRTIMSRRFQAASKKWNQIPDDWLGIRVDLPAAFLVSQSEDDLIAISPGVPEIANTPQVNPPSPQPTLILVTPSPSHSPVGTPPLPDPVAPVIAPPGIVQPLEDRPRHIATPSRSRRGRPPLRSPKKGSRSTRTHVRNISDSHSEGTISQVLISKYKKSGKLAQVRLLKESVKSPQRATKMEAEMARGRRTAAQNPFNAEEALGLLLELSLTDRQYIILQRACQKKGYTKLFPSIESVRAEKLKSRPGPTSCIQVEENGKSAFVPLQNLLDHTSGRIVETIRDVLIADAERANLTTIVATFSSSWGMDGSSGQSRYKQRGSSGETMFDDKSLFATCLSPLRMERPECVYWLNPAPQSSNYCRPIKLQFSKETFELVIAEKSRVEAEIRTLHSFRIQVSSHLEVIINYDLHLTAIDGKILNFFTNAGAMANCPLCYATPKQFNVMQNLDSDVFAIKNDNWKYGASPLHALIRFLECVLHLGYRPFCQWRRTGDLMAKSKQRQREIQQAMIDGMGLRVDFPKDGGSGTSNDGNTARRAFESYVMFSSITGISEELLKYFSTILIALNCKMDLDADKFGSLCRAAALLYLELYPWYPMPSTVHKILVHGEEIIRKNCLPVGFLGEEAGESRNKLYKQIRLHHTRKSSRKATMQDLMHRSLETSDPKLSSQRWGTKLFPSRRRPLPPDVIALLKSPSSVQSVSRVLDFDDQAHIDNDDGLDFELDAEPDDLDSLEFEDPMDMSDLS